MNSSTHPVAIVTGASAGIGRAVSIALLQAGYHVALSGRSEERLQETLTLAGDTPGNALLIPTDIRSESSVQSLFAQTVETFGRLDLLFNNAGIFPPGKPLDELPLEEWQASVDTNFTGAFLCLREAFRYMKKQHPQGGRIINNGSIAAQVPRPGSVAYSATKHAVTGLTKTANLDGRNFNICVGQIDIGNVETEMTQIMKQGILQPNGQVEPEALMQMEDVVNTVMHMVSLPLEANIPFVTVMANRMPYIGRG